MPAKSKSNPVRAGRRQEAIGGCIVTIIKRGDVETVRKGPKCRWCGKPLRPNYDTLRGESSTRHYFDRKPAYGEATFDEVRGQWVIVSTVYPVVRRVFLGSFGMYKDNHFCGLNCGRDFGLAVAESLTGMKSRIVNIAGEDVADHFSKDCKV